MSTMSRDQDETLGDTAKSTVQAAAVPHANPFVGPVPISGKEVIHGRRRETDELVHLIVSKRIVLLFSPSGAGKTSLIQAALAPRLRDLYKLEALPIVRRATISSPMNRSHPSIAIR